MVGCGMWTEAGRVMRRAYRGKPLKRGVWLRGQSPVGSEFKLDASTSSSVTLACMFLCLCFSFVKLG